MINMENKFGYLKEESLESLNNELIDLQMDLEEIEKVFESKDDKSEAKTDAWSDIKYLHEKIEYIENLIDEMTKENKTR